MVVKLSGIRISSRLFKPLTPKTASAVFNTHLQSIRHRSINVTTPESAPNTTEKKYNHISTENKSLSQYLKEYKEWFPSDAIGASLIESYERLHSFPQETIKIGVLYSDESIKSTSKILETILADPLASNNEVWFKEITNRDRSHNIQFAHQETVDINVSGTSHGSISSIDQFSIPSPVLNSSARPGYMNPNTNITLNDLEIFEINDIDQFPKLNACHFFVYITNNITSPIKLPTSLSDKILITLLDNNDYTPSSRESTPLQLTKELDGTLSTPRIIKVNTQKSYEGIVDFLQHDTKASLNYLDSMVESNIFRFLKVLGYNLQIEQLIRWNMSKFINKVNRDEINIQALEELYSDMRTNQINKFSSQMHSELQNEFIPNTQKFIRKQLPWWSLILFKNNAENDLKDFMSKQFMSKSIENYNFFRGKIIASLQNHQFGKYQPRHDDVSNPLITMKQEFLDTRIRDEVQITADTFVANGILYFVAPLTILSGCSYIFFDFSLNAAMSIFALGCVMTCHFISQAWSVLQFAWIRKLIEMIRVCIDRDCVENGLVKELTNSYNEERKMIAVKRRILKGIQTKVGNK